MSHKRTPVIYHLKDVWEAYALQLLAVNPNWVGITHNAIQNYYLYRKGPLEGSKPQIIEVFNFKQFKAIVTEYFELAKEEIINGNAINIGSGVGKICAKRVERDHSKKVVDYVKTNLRPKVVNSEGKLVPDKLVFFTNDDWTRVGWFKFGKTRNEFFYEFSVTKALKNGKAFASQFVQAQVKNPLLKYKYPYWPLIPN